MSYKSPKAGLRVHSRIQSRSMVEALSIYEHKVEKKDQ